MKEIITQYKSGCLRPSSFSDHEVLSENYKENQLVRCQTYAVSKGMEPSVDQNNTLHACFQLVADNHPKLKTKEQVKFHIKVALHFVHEDLVAVRKDGTVQFSYRSFSFKELKNMERLRIFDRSFELCADLLGISVEELIKEAKARMQRRG